MAAAPAWPTKCSAPMFEANNEAAIIIHGMDRPARKYSSAWSVFRRRELKAPHNATPKTKRRDATTMKMSTPLSVTISMNRILKGVRNRDLTCSCTKRSILVLKFNGISLH